MKKGFKYVSVVVALLLVGVLSFYAGQRSRFAYLIKNERISAMEKMEATLYLIQKYYVDSVNPDKLVEDLIPVLMNQLDPHSSFLTAEQRQQELENIDGYFYGIGVTFNYLKDTVVVLDVVPNGPSDIAGILPGERITHVDGQSIEHLDVSADSIRSKLKGPNHSVVRLQVRNPESGEIRDVAVTRGVVNMNAVDASYMINDSLGVIKIASFVSNTYNDFMAAFAKLEQQGMKGLVIDLRDNPGGVMQAALLLSNEVLPAGRLIMYMQGNSVPREDFRSDGTGSLQNIPIYVLINEISASASEILSGAIQDNDAGILIGRRTFGKGLVQKPFEYYDGSSIHLTIARYYTPSGRCIQRQYKLGQEEEYSMDWLERLQSGELFHQDSIHVNEELLFHTVSGRPVYGAGGITPDIFIPRDTIGYNSYTSQIFTKGVIPAFAFRYADQYRGALKSLGDAQTCYTFLTRQGLVWQMANFANQEYGIRVRNFLIYQAEEKLEDLLISVILNYTYGRDASEKAGNIHDPMMQCAVKLFDSGVYTPMQVPQEDLMLPDTLAQSVFEKTPDVVD